MGALWPGKPDGEARTGPSASTSTRRPCGRASSLGVGARRVQDTAECGGHAFSCIHLGLWEWLPSGEVPDRVSDPQQKARGERRSQLPAAPGWGQKQSRGLGSTHSS